MAWVAVALVAVALAAGGAWLGWHAWQVPPPTPAPAATLFTVTPADEAQIDADRATGLTLFRLAANPRILVLDFPDLRQQAAMLNRVAALVEKAGLPRDRVLGDADLDAAIRARGDTPETFYYGHDYRAADLARFFALADCDHVRLTTEEELLRALLAQEGYLRPGSMGALISIVRAGADSLMDARARSTILHHELSHGEYFSVPAYAAYAAGFWRNGLTDDQRSRFTRFLVSQDYDPAQEDLLVNETQAYLMHTADPRFFSAAAVGMTPEQIEALRARFRAGQPPGWLSDATPQPGPVPAPRPASAPRQRGAVSRVMASPVRRSPRRRACSIAACSARR